MKIEIRKSFEKDADKIPASIQQRLAQVINQISKAKRISDMNSCKKLSGYKNVYRIRLGSYRVGFFFDNDTIELVRVLQRKDIYRYFP
jgi:mRNA interferase RelE/StbE